MVLLVVLQQVIVQVEDKEQLRDARVTLDQVFSKNGLLLIEVEVLDLNFVPKLLRQI